MSKNIATHIKPDTFRWLARQHAKGMDVNVVSALQKAHGQSMDDALAWFERLPSPKTDSAFEILRLGLTNNRPDAASAVAKYLDTNPTHWFSPDAMWHNALNSFGDNDPGFCLFARMFQSVEITRWFFELHPQFKSMFLDPNGLDCLEKGLARAGLHVQVAWPAIAHRIFEHEIDPTWYTNEMQDAYKQQLESSFSHDPAAQCYFLYNRFVNRPWTINNSVHPSTKSDDSNVQMLYKKLHALKNNEDVASTPSTPIVDNLMLAVDLEMPPRDFYFHAERVFNGQPLENEIIVDAQLLASV